MFCLYFISVTLYVTIFYIVVLNLILCMKEYYSGEKNERTEERGAEKTRSWKWPKKWSTWSLSVERGEY